MADDSLYDTMIELAEQLYADTRALLVSKGIKETSAVLKSVEIQADQNAIDFLANDYLEYLSSGRKKGGRRVPIKYLLEFIRKNGIVGRNKKGKIVSANSLAFAMQYNIWRNGIKAKNFMDALAAMFAATGEQKISTDVEESLLTMLDDAKIN